MTSVSEQDSPSGTTRHSATDISEEHTYGFRPTQSRQQCSGRQRPYGPPDGGHPGLAGIPTEGGGTSGYCPSVEDAVEPKESSTHQHHGTIRGANSAQSQPGTWGFKPSTGKKQKSKIEIG